MLSFHNYYTGKGIRTNYVLVVFMKRVPNSNRQARKRGKKGGRKEGKTDGRQERLFLCLGAQLEQELESLFAFGLIRTTNRA